MVIFNLNKKNMKVNQFNEENPEVELPLFSRVIKEMEVYPSGAEAAKDHLEMASAHLHEEFAGKDQLRLATGINTVLYNLECYMDCADVESANSNYKGILTALKTPKRSFEKKKN